MGKLMAVAIAVAARLTLIDSATISRKSCNSLMAARALLRAAGSEGERDKLLHGGDLDDGTGTGGFILKDRWRASFV